MLRISLRKREVFDEETLEFKTIEPRTLRLEHSLIALSKWESKWCKPFLTSSKTQKRTPEEMIDYIRCMSLDEIEPEDLLGLTQSDLNKISEYISLPMTATTFRDDPNARPSREVVTAEIIYYWMITLGIPFECQKWHLNRLMTLIKVCSIKNAPEKKMSKKQMLSQRNALNSARRRQMNTRG